MYRVGKRLSFKELSLAVILLTGCSLWFFQDILDLHVAVAMLCMVAVVMQCLTGRVRFIRSSCVLLLFAVGLLISIALNGASMRVLYRAAVFCMLILYACIANYGIDVLEGGRKLLIYVGLFCAGTILLQFVLRGSFNGLYYALLRSTAKEEALFYYNRGYFSGINVKPHESAGMVSMALAALFVERSNRKKKVEKYLPLLLFVPLLLTGKRAITVIAVVALFLLYLLTQAANKRWLKIIGISLLALFAAYGALLIVRANTDSALFARFALLFESDGESLIDSTRLRLWNDAWNMWKRNKLFGVGWGRFVDLSVSVLSYSRNHSVNLDYLQILCETGIVGFVLMMTPVITMAVRAIRLGRFAARKGLPANEKSIAMFAVYIQFFILMYALIEVPFYSIVFFTYYIFSCMVVSWFYRRYLKPEKKRRKMRRLMH